MGLFRRRAKGDGAESADPGPDALPAFDAQGREYLIPREVMRSEVLPRQFTEAGDDPDAIYQAIAIALGDGFFAEVVPHARHLLDVDPDRERATTVLGIALMRSGRLDEAEALFDAYLSEVGPSGVVLVNLAKVYADRDQHDRAEETLWTALRIDPNQHNGLDWWGAIHRERGGEPAFLEAMRRASELAGSWRPQLWLARHHLESDDLSSALQLYRAALPGASRDGDGLMMVSGDLGNNGFVREALDLVEPLYDPPRHGAPTGFNLVQACVQLGEIERGRRILAGVEQLGRYDLLGPIEQLKAQLQ